MPQTWRYIDSGPNIGAYNMAVDEELLARAQAGEQKPVLRFYAWSPPAVSLGRFQKMKSSVNTEACRRLGIDIVRRVTGGRAVLHRNELTYSIVARTDHSLFPQTVLGTYKVIAAGLVTGLRLLGLPAEMVTREDSSHASLVQKRPKEASCFSSPSWYEIVVQGRKIVGSAQRRAGRAFLQHGSILIDYDPQLEAVVIPGEPTSERVTSIQRELGRTVTGEEIKSAILSGFREALGIRFSQTN